MAHREKGGDRQTWTHRKGERGDKETERETEREREREREKERERRRFGSDGERERERERERENQNTSAILLMILFDISFSCDTTLAPCPQLVSRLDHQDIAPNH